MVRGGGPEFPEVDPRFDVLPRHIFGPFWSLQIVDTICNRHVVPQGGSFLTGWGSVRRAARYSTLRYLADARRAELR